MTPPPARAYLVAALALTWTLAACAPAAQVGVPASLALEVTAVADDVALRLPAPGAFEGNASWYGPGFAGRRTASGEVFDPEALTAAHRTLPFGTVVRVVSLDTGRAVEVRINDRGPFKPNRVIDLSRAAAASIGMLHTGIAPVRVQPLAPGAGGVRLAVAPDLRGFEVRSRLHLPGQLLLLHSERVGEPVMVRVVAGESGSAADVFVAPELYLVLGPIVAVRVD